MIKTPKFWATRNIISLFLLPVSLFYFFGFFLNHNFGRRRKVKMPTICIGNLIAGGSGKTPTAIAIGEILKDLNVNFAFLSRGYRVQDREEEVSRVSIDEKDAAQKFSDEPLILAETAPTFIASNRLFAVEEIGKTEEYQAVILDDAMQSSSIDADLTILVVDGKIGFGNGFMLPAGPMREPLSSGLKRTDIVVLIGDAKPELLKKLSLKKIFRASISVKNMADFVDQKLIAFCGLAYPQKFFSLLQNAKMDVVKIHDFPDHHFYSEFELETLCREAEKCGANLITTKKDWVKFTPEYRQKISYLDIELKFDDPDEIKEEIKKIL